MRGFNAENQYDISVKALRLVLLRERSPIVAARPCLEVKTVWLAGRVAFLILDQFHKLSLNLFTSIRLATRVTAKDRTSYQVSNLDEWLAFRTLG
jgi:hypothetical protein